jgi:NADH:ubiquinone oxidoreductase subunit 2 (subunit N)
MVLFNQTIQAGYIALVIVAVVNSIISVGYYFKLILAMYTKEPNEENKNSFCYLCCRYYNCIEYRFGFISIFSFDLLV